VTTPGKPEILWADIECSGLDAENDVLMEVGFRLTDWWGDEISRFTRLVWDYRWRARLAGNEFVFNMHRDSGLARDLSEVEKHPSSQRNYFLSSRVADEAMAWLEDNAKGLGPIDGKFPMAGNSLQGVDRPFLKKYMPEVFEFFHYRDLDVSSIREACRLLNPMLHGREPVVPKAHRPQQDINNSIALWRHYADNFFFTER
jgi:oligoribonuclease